MFSNLNRAKKNTTRHFNSIRCINSHTLEKKQFLVSISAYPFIWIKLWYWHRANPIQIKPKKTTALFLVLQITSQQQCYKWFAHSFPNEEFRSKDSPMNVTFLFQYYILFITTKFECHLPIGQEQELNYHLRNQIISFV